MVGFFTNSRFVYSKHPGSRRIEIEDVLEFIEYQYTVVHFFDQQVAGYGDQIKKFLTGNPKGNNQNGK